MSETPEWRRSSFCSDGACAEVKVDDNAVFLRNSNRPESTIELTPAEWEAIKKAIRNGEF